MNSSIRRFLLFNLVLSITLILSLLMVGGYFLNNQSIRDHLNTHLMEAYHFLNVSLKASNMDVNYIKRLQTLIDKNSKYKKIIEDNIQFQIWNSKGNVILHSPKIPNSFPHMKKSGFRNNKIDDTTWRIYTKYNKQLGITISVAKSYDFERQLITQIGFNNLLLIFLTYPLLGLLIWLTVTSSLRSIKKVTQTLSKRAVTDFEPINVKNIPIEIQPLTESLNHLFFRLRQAFDRNKNFASDAAHELRTPLAALKTQTQVALLAETEKERKTALQNLLLGVNRSIHVVQQLLTLSRLGVEDTVNDLYPLDLSKVSAEVLAQLVPLALEKNIEIELFKPKELKKIYANETSLGILIRNLVDNAIRYTPDGSSIEVRIVNESDKVLLRVIDNGPGISPELRTRVFERFYRILGTKTSGSGLGLAIVQQIAELHNAKIKLDTSRSGKGLVVEVAFPVSQNNSH